MPAVDSLNIKVDASARSANQQLDKLVKKMVKHSISMRSVLKMDTVAQKIRERQKNTINWLKVMVMKGQSARKDLDFFK